MQMETAWEAEAVEEDAKEAARRREQQELQDRVAALEALVQQLRAKGAAGPPAAAAPAGGPAASTASGSTTAAAVPEAGSSPDASTAGSPDQARGGSSSRDADVCERTAGGPSVMGWWGRLLLPFQGRGEGPVPSNASGSQGLVPSDDEQRMAAHMKDSSMSITERRIAEGAGL